MENNWNCEFDDNNNVPVRSLGQGFFLYRIGMLWCSSSLSLSLFILFSGLPTFLKTIWIWRRKLNENKIPNTVRLVNIYVQHFRQYLFLTCIQRRKDC